SSNKCSFTFKCTPDSAKCGKLGEVNALKCSAEIFVVRLPRYSLYSKYKPTSLTTGWLFSCIPAICIAVIRFSLAAVRKSPMGNCEPVKITGFERFLSIKLNADAVYDMVSDPCNTTNPSKSSRSEER